MPKHAELLQEIHSVFPSSLERPITSCPCCTDLALTERLNRIPRSELSDSDLRSYGADAIWTIGNYEQWLYFVPEFLSRALDHGAIFLDSIWYKIQVLNLMPGSVESTAPWPAASHDLSKLAQPTLPGKWASRRAQTFQQVVDNVWDATREKNSKESENLLTDAVLAGVVPHGTAKWNAMNRQTMVRLLEEVHSTGLMSPALVPVLGAPEVGALLLTHAADIKPSWRFESLWKTYESLATIHESDAPSQNR